MAKEPKVITGDPNTGIAQGAIEPSWSIIKEGERVGVFWFDDETQQFEFRGNLGLSAEIFVAAVLAKMNEGCGNG